jgi:4-hydroxyphenylpyruvate dioxygenase
MGFAKVARHRRKAITVYRQGDVDYLVNEEPNTHAARFAVLHGPAPLPWASVLLTRHMRTNALVVSVLNQQTRSGARKCSRSRRSRDWWQPLYLVDRYGAKGSVYDDGFAWFGGRDAKPW